MQKIRFFKDERGYTFDSTELEFYYGELKATGETEEETFEEYLTNCTDKNGTLTEVFDVEGD